MAADKFAKLALGTTIKKEFSSIHGVPRSIQKIIFLDRIGIPNFRSHVLRGPLFITRPHSYLSRISTTDICSYSVC